ncbi:hypothetical protein D9619_011823 [Psilocybe cf. subviscida]|uniref:SHSP domain-containing protein n=1 Tax=Psilocybe cf. subviscida TaxID=2480587 RepID=A0A8H5B0X6_9AGAR|nr:hypothetical protein D9619_011823 [Psilocybe cf. subviscida]
MDLHEDTKSNQVTATFELPGLKKEDVSIDLHNSRLTISGETKSDQSYDEAGWAVKERRFGKFSRTLQVPEGVKVCLSSYIFHFFKNSNLSPIAIGRPN